MLNKVFKFINKNGSFSTKLIADNLDISESIVEDLKNRLQMMGYIKKVEEGCSSEACAKCSCGCAKTKKLDRTVKWEITPKGKSLIDKIGG